MSEYKDLHINRDVFETLIGEFCEGVEFTRHDSSNGLQKYKISVPEEKECVLNVYLRSNGKTTFTTNEGGNPDLSIRIAEYLKQKASFDPNISSSVYIKKLPSESFDALCEFLEQYCNAYNAGEKVLTNGRQITYKSKYGDKIFLNYYSNGAFNVQGQSLLLKSQVIEGLSNYLTYGEIVEATLDSFKIEDFDKSTAEKLLVARLPTAGSLLHANVKILIFPVFITERLQVDTTDYSFVVFPILRGMEGFLKQLFLDFGIPIANTGKAAFGTYLEDPAKTTNFNMSVIGENSISCIYTKRSIEKLFNFYRKNRHAIFHVDGTLIGTRLIKDMDTARSLINECFELIENCSLAITNKNLKFLA